MEELTVEEVDFDIISLQVAVVLFEFDFEIVVLIPELRVLVQDRLYCLVLLAEHLRNLLSSHVSLLHLPTVGLQLSHHPYQRLLQLAQVLLFLAESVKGGTGQLVQCLDLMLGYC